MKHVKAIEAQGTQSGKPKKEVRIVASGELPTKKGGSLQKTAGKDSAKKG